MYKGENGLSQSLVPDGWNDKNFYETNYNDLPNFAKVMVMKYAAR